MADRTCSTAMRCFRDLPSVPLRVRAILLVLMAAACSGCGATRIDLRYQPIVEGVQGSGRIVVCDLEDARPDKPVVVKYRSPIYTFRTIETGDGDVGKWVADALASELRKAGFDVTRCGMPPKGGSEPAVTGRVSVLRLEEWPPTVTIRSELLVVQQGKAAINAQFSGNYTDVRATATADKSYFEQMVQAALQDLMIKAVPQIARSIGK